MRMDLQGVAKRSLPSNISSYKIGDNSIGFLDDVPGGAISSLFRSIRDTMDFDFEDENKGASKTPSIPTMQDIEETSRAQNLEMKLQTLGPFFRITATSLETTKEVGRAEGVIRVWLDGKILHLDSIRLTRETLSLRKSIFGVGLFLGAVAVRHGFDSGCSTAQLLAINDTDLYHSKLVRFYRRMGFKVVHEVDGSKIGDVSHMLVWGGKGTRMDANVEDLLLKWCARFKLSDT